MIKYETDSRKVKPGQIFVALKGHTVDGHDYIDSAIKNKATKVVVEKDVNCSVEVLKVENTEEYLKEVLVKEYSQEFKGLKIIGITGTNGKTTTAYLCYQFLNLFNNKCAYIGTLGYISEDEVIETNNTTPDILTIYKLLMKAKEQNCKTIVMEVSSHSLSFERIKGLHLDIVAFSNLTEDHLDYHKTMQNYLEAKLKIIDYMDDSSVLIVNNDDVSSIHFTNKFGSSITLGFKSDSDYLITNTLIKPDKTTINFKYNNQEYQVTTNLTSKFNVYNYMTTLVILNNLNYSIEDILKITDKIKAPKGRCETYKVGSSYAVIDYAHTPDAVEKVITAYNELKKARVISILGCGGDRDPIKRPIMGRLATDLSDYVILTNDNPRCEDEHKIMQDILKGITKDNYEIEFDRKVAIKKGLSMLKDEDILLILGKGHEDYQIIGHDKIHLDDAEEVLNYINTL